VLSNYDTNLHSARHAPARGLAVATPSSLRSRRHPQCKALESRQGGTPIETGRRRAPAPVVAAAGEIAGVERGAGRRLGVAA
jgi:hypothetical protein